jgi:hypothetical protein
VGGYLLERLFEHRENPQSWWAIGRLGARAPFHGSAHEVVACEVAEAWLERALDVNWSKAPQAAFAATLLARKTGDRQRDISEPLRQTILSRLRDANVSASWIQMVQEMAPFDVSTEQRIFGDSLPPGLKLLN